jgi:hypothetical protein
MVLIAPSSRAEMDERHASRRPDTAGEAPAAAATIAERRNVGAVLDLGNLQYYEFRGRAYGVPPVPYKVGQRILGPYLTLRAITQLTPENSARYYAALAELPEPLWAHLRPVGRLRRALRRLGLLRNPLEGATDRDLMELADFFLQCRMKSTAGPRPACARRAPSTS